MTISDEQAVDLLESMLRVPSLCGQEDQLANLLVDALSAAGFEACRDTTGNVIGTIGPRSGPAREVVILGHMDTVPGSIPVERRDGLLYGRGSVDAKGPLATGIVAAARAARLANLRLTVIGAVQEEGPSMGARHLAKRPAPDFLIIAEPSGWDSIVLGYKGSQRFNVELTVPCSHSAGEDLTAAERAFSFWSDLVAWCAGVIPASTSQSRTFDALTPTLIGMTTSTNGLEDIAYLQIGMRLPLGIDPDMVKREVPNLLPEGNFCFNHGDPAVRASKSTPLVAGFLRSIRSEGGSPSFKVKTGTSDMNVVGPVWGCPMLAYGPGDSRLDHTPQEHIVVADYLHAIRVLTCVLEELR